MRSKVLSQGAIVVAVLCCCAGAYAQCVVTEDLSGVQCQTLLAGQTIDAGAVCVEVLGSDLLVTYVTDNGWELVETHTWVGDSLGKLPQTKQGNPVPGRFPYQSGDISGATSHTVVIPLAVLGIDCDLNASDTTLFVAAHAALQKPGGAGGGTQTETGWADGDRFVDKGNWGTYFSTVVSCDCETPPSGKCETAFAQGGACFLDLNLNGVTFNRWGWTVGPLAAGAYSFPIYAGAGQCDVTKGTLVGSLEVYYSNGVADVYFLMNSGFTLDETHLYIGNDILPKNNGEYTVAPGQYPRQHGDLNGVTSDNYLQWEDISGEIYVVAHAVVCGL
jgi:hypothetical protein